MTFLFAIGVVVAFALILERLELASRAREVVERSRDSLAILRNAALDDRAKETALRSQAVQLFRLLGVLLWGGIFALGLPLLAVWLLDLWGLASFDAVLALLARVDFLVLASVVGTASFLLIHRMQRP